MGIILYRADRDLSALSALGLLFYGPRHTFEIYRMVLEMQLDDHPHAQARAKRKGNLLVKLLLLPFRGTAKSQRKARQNTRDLQVALQQASRTTARSAPRTRRGELADEPPHRIPDRRGRRGSSSWP